MLQNWFAANVKMELISELLLRKDHEVEILSQGDVDKPHFKFFPGFSGPQAFHPKVDVRYASTLPIKRVTGLWSNSRLQALFDARHKVVGFDVVLIYNLKGPQVANHAIRDLGFPVILEYEDDIFVDVSGREEDSFMNRVRRTGWRLAEFHFRLFWSVTVPSVTSGSFDPANVTSQRGDDYLQIAKTGSGAA